MPPRQCVCRRCNNRVVERPKRVRQLLGTRRRRDLDDILLVVLREVLTQRATSLRPPHVSAVDRRGCTVHRTRHAYPIRCDGVHEGRLVRFQFVVAKGSHSLLIEQLRHECGATITLCERERAREHFRDRSARSAVAGCTDEVRVVEPVCRAIRRQLHRAPKRTVGFDPRNDDARTFERSQGARAIAPNQLGVAMPECGVASLVCERRIEQCNGRAAVTTQNQCVGGAEGAQCGRDESLWLSRARGLRTERRRSQYSAAPRADGNWDDRTLMEKHWLSGWDNSIA